MATVLTHAAIPLLLGRAWRPAQGSPRKLAVVAVALALLPDADYLGLLFDARPEDALGHRGFSHALLFAALTALVATVAAFGRKASRGTFAYLFAAAASHPLLDMLARGEGGVALFAPLSAARVAAPLQPLHTIPLGITEAFGRWGALVLAGELLVVVVPLWLAVRAIELRRGGGGRTLVAGVAAVWLVLLASAAVIAPSFLGASPPPVLAAADHSGIPTAGLPEGKLVTRFEDLEQAGVFGRPLTPASSPWSSSFFPAWYGAEAGRWQDSKLTLVWRTLAGFEGPFAPLSPAEKYDAAVRDPGWKATHHALSQTHNGQPRFWFGLCNGIAAAALQHPEPFRTVDAVAPSGAVVRFHPQDIKALLGAAHYWNQSIVEVGDSCGVVRLDSGQSCSMNPATLVVALTNLLGLGRSSFLIDVHPTPQNQYYAVAEATVRITRAPYPAQGARLAADLEGKVQRLADVEVRLLLSSTTLGYGPGDVVDPADPTRYQKVGLRAVPFSWAATVALDAEGQLVGGIWKGEPPVGPDSIAFLSGGPLLTDGGFVDYNPGLKWSLLEALAQASVSEASAPPRVDVAAALDGGTGSH